MKRPPEKLPDPWLFDSEALLREFDRCRELVMKIPVSDLNATHFGINIPIDAIWNLQQNLRYLLLSHFRRDIGNQRCFRASLRHRRIQCAYFQLSDNLHNNYMSYGVKSGGYTYWPPYADQRSAALPG
jgi:hypothetical protein